MVILEDLGVGTEVRDVVTVKAGTIIELRLRRPLMARVVWHDGKEGWYHPEQLTLPSAQPKPEQPKMTTWGRTTPQYLVNLRAELRQKAKTKPPYYAVPGKAEILSKVACDVALTKREFALLGIPWPPPRGWKKQILLDCPSWHYNKKK
jgi:hypothetical protein